MMKRFEDTIARARSEGTNTQSAEKLFERSREFFRAKKYRQALATALQSEAEAERVSLQQAMASQAVATVEGKLRSLGHPAPPVERLTEESHKALNAGEYVKGLDLAIRASDALADFRAALDEISEVRIQAAALRQTAREIGAEAGKLDRFIHDGDEALSAGDLDAARGSFSQCLEWGIGLVRAHLKESLSKAEELAVVCRKLEIDPTAALNKLSEARTQIEGENFAAASARIGEGSEIAHRELAARMNRAIAEAAENLAHAKRLGSDSQEAEALLRQAGEAAARGEYESALDVVGRAVEHVESAKVVEKRFVDLTFKAETTIRNGKKYGIDMHAAEKRLSESMDLRRRDIADGIKAAEDAYRMAWEAVEAFAPNLKATLELGPAKLNEPVEATLTLENAGKGLAKGVRVRVLGDAEVEGLTELAALRAHGREVLHFKLKMTASGSVPLALQLVSHRVFDDKEYVQETIAQIDVAETPQERPKRLVADLESRCPICKGSIKKGFKVLQCACGRDFHELCAARVGRCPVCFRPLGNPAE
jgi:tetratricopeptide (TPR) repeat protein